jgi:type IV pilus assembly protein PilA
MSNFTRKLRLNDGFTLVELMVVVAIIGLLSAVAIPNFKKYQAKAKTSEAKLQLASLYSAETAWVADYDYYAPCLNLMGFDPSGEVSARYYAVGFRTTGGHTDLTNAGAPAACTSANVQAASNAAYTGTNGVHIYPAGKRMSGVGAATSPADSGFINLAAFTIDTDGTSFVAGAAGKIDKNKITTSDADQWSIDQTKRLRNTLVGY